VGGGRLIKKSHYVQETKGHINVEKERKVFEINASGRGALGVFFHGEYTP